MEKYLTVFLAMIFFNEDDRLGGRCYYVIPNHAVIKTHDQNRTNIYNNPISNGYI